MSEVQQYDYETKLTDSRSRQALYAKLAKYAPRAITQLGKLINSKHDSIKLRAIVLLLSKVLPDLKVIDNNGASGITINVSMGNGYTPSTIQEAQVIDTSISKSLQELSNTIASK